MKQLDALDVLLMLLLLTIFLPISFRATTLTKQLYVQQAEDDLRDKNVRDRSITTDSVEISGGEFTAWEVLLTSQIQNYYMPQPKTMSVGETSDVELGNQWVLEPVLIDSTVEAERDRYLQIFSSMINRIDFEQDVEVIQEDGTVRTEPAVSRYTLEYHGGKTPLADTDDFYYFGRVRDDIAP